MCKLNHYARRLMKAKLWADKNKIDLEKWPGGLEDFAEALRSSVPYRV